MLTILTVCGCIFVAALVFIVLFSSWKVRHWPGGRCVFIGTSLGLGSLLLVAGTFARWVEILGWLLMLVGVVFAGAGSGIVRWKRRGSS